MPKNPPPRLSDSFTFLKLLSRFGVLRRYAQLISFYIYSYVCTPVCLCQRTHKYNNVSFRIWVIKVFISVKMRLKNKLFFGKDLVEWKIVSTFALAFEKYGFS
mgnify:CR=1 FL=1